MSEEFNVKSLASGAEQDARKVAYELFDNCPIPENEILANTGLFVKRQELTKSLFFNELYDHIKGVHGVIMEFGVRWGQNLVTLANLRGIHEPFNHSRKLVGFDTFEGFLATDAADGDHQIINSGSLAVTKGYEAYLQQVLDYHERESPLNHVKKNSLRKGNAPDQLKIYLEENPETIVAMAWFDMTLYKPTFECLQLLKGHITKGTILGFDELNDHQFPGETVAVKEALGLENISVQRNRFSGAQSYVIVE